MNTLKLTSAFIAPILLLSMLISCGQKNDPAVEETGTDLIPNNTEPETTEISDSLPPLDFEGSTVTISCRGDEDTILEITADEENGDLVNDAVFRRNMSVEERLNVKLNCIPADGWASYDNTLKKYRASIQAGDSDYDLIAAWSSRVPLIATEGLFIDLNTVQYIDKAKPWWNQDMVNNLAVNDKMFFLTGDIAITEISTMYVFFYNKNLGENFGIGDIYQTVFDRQWTLDKLKEIVAPIYTDLNGDSKRDFDDLYGAALKNGSNTCDGLLAATDFYFYNRTSNGSYELNTDYSKLISVGEKVYDLFFNNPGVFSPKEYSDDANALGRKFRSGSLMLYTEWLGTIQEEGLNDMDDDFGILPYPLMSEEQKEYLTYVQAVTVWCMPVTAKDTDMNGAVLEALAAENYRSVIPAYFETAMKVKYSRDNESAQILDIMRNTAHLDFGIMYNLSLGNPYYAFRDVIGAGKSDFSSYLAKKEKEYQKQLDKLLQSFE